MFSGLKSAIVTVVITLILLACSWSLLNPKMFFTHDFVHGARIVELTRALQDGHFPVRWSSNLGYGYGMPVFEFYAPLPFYVGALLYMYGVPLVVAAKLLFFISSLGTVIGSYLLGKKLFGKTGGLVVAATITLAPYRAVNLFVRGAIGESWGIMAAVWVLYSTVLVIRRERNGWLSLILSLVSLFLSHNLVTIIFLPFALLFTICFFMYEHWPISWKGIQKNFNLFLGLIGSYLLSIDLACFYLLPSFFEKDLTRVEEKTTGGYFDFHLHFLYIRQFFRSAWGYGGSEWGPNDKISFFLGFGEYLGIAISIVALFYFVFVIAKRKKILVGKSVFLLGTFLVFIAMALAMTLEKSVFIWDHIAIFKFIQFPWRYYSVGIIFIGLASAFFTKFLVRKWYVAASVLIILVTLIVNWQYFKPERFLDHDDDLYYTDPNKLQTHMSSVLPDYIPKSFPEEATPPVALVTCGDTQSACAGSEVLINRVQEKLISVTTTQPTDFILNIAYFPGWMTELDGNQTAYSVTPQGTIKVSVPTGTHLVGVRFTDTPIRQVADTISLVSLFILGALVIRWNANHVK